LRDEVLHAEAQVLNTVCELWSAACIPPALREASHQRRRPSCRYSTWHCPMHGPSRTLETDLAGCQHFQQSLNHDQSLTVDALGISISLILLCLVPLNNETVTEGQCRSRIRRTASNVSNEAPCS
jgi:hypothetical protein